MKYEVELRRKTEFVEIEAGDPTEAAIAAEKANPGMRAESVESDEVCVYVLDRCIACGGPVLEATSYLTYGGGEEHLCQQCAAVHESYSRHVESRRKSG